MLLYVSICLNNVLIQGDAVLPLLFDVECFIRRVEENFGGTGTESNTPASALC
jgi:hypothetical protein